MIVLFIQSRQITAVLVRASDYQRRIQLEKINTINFDCLPINILIISAAFKESFLKSYTELAMIGLFGITTFSLFELFGPIVIGLSIIVSFLYYTIFKNKLV